MNNFKTFILLAGLTGLLMVIGNYMAGSSGMMIMLVIGAAMNLGTYWFSDKIVLKMYRAKEATEAEVPQLYRVVRKLVEKSGMPMPKVYLIPDHSPNAFATGRDPAHAAVAATVGIMNLLSEQELEGVMAHELAHVQNRDTLISAVAATIAGAISSIGSILQWGAMFGGGRNSDNDNRGGMIGMLVMAIMAPIAAMLIQMAISRSREYAADRKGAEMCGKPLALAGALGRLHNAVLQVPMQGGTPATAHLFIVNPFKGGGMANLFSTHPPMEERIKRLTEMAREFA